MTRTIDYFRSPYADLAHAQLRRIAAKHVATIAYSPFRMLELMRLVGNTPTTVECKTRTSARATISGAAAHRSPSINDALGGASA
jgi:2-hydroxychromene-2-carboxylate isomerase